MSRTSLILACFTLALVLAAALGVSLAPLAEAQAQPAGLHLADAVATAPAAAVSEDGTPLRISVIEARLETIADVGRWAAGLIGFLVTLLFSLFAWMLRTARSDILTAIQDVRDQATRAEDAARGAMPRLECAGQMGALDRRIDASFGRPATAAGPRSVP